MTNSLVSGIDSILNATVRVKQRGIQYRKPALMQYRDNDESHGRERHTRTDECMNSNERGLTCSSRTVSTTVLLIHIFILRRNKYFFRTSIEHAKKLTNSHHILCNEKNRLIALQCLAFLSDESFIPTNIRSEYVFIYFYYYNELEWRIIH